MRWPPILIFILVFLTSQPFGIVTAEPTVVINNMTGTSGFFESPAFPDIYPNNYDATYTITAPNGYVVLVDFLVFQLEQPYDTVIIFDGVQGDSKIIKMTGNMSASSYSSTSNIMTVVFNSDLTGQRDGFVARYTALPFVGGASDELPGCPERIDRGAFGILMSPGYPNLYPSSASCDYHVKAGDGMRVALKFYSFITEDCCDSLALYDWNEIVSQALNTRTMAGTLVSNATTATSVYSESIDMTMHFSSDLTREFTGFCAIYRLVPAVEARKYDLPPSVNNTTTPRNHLKDLGKTALQL